MIWLHNWCLGFKETNKTNFYFGNSYKRTPCKSFNVFPLDCVQPPYVWPASFFSTKNYGIPRSLSHPLFSLHCKKFIYCITKYLGNFWTKTLGKFSKPVWIFREIWHTIITNRVTFTAKYFGLGVTKRNCLNYKRNTKIMQNTVCLLYRIDNLY